MIDKIPRQNLIVSIAARNEEIRIGQVGIVNKFTLDFTKFMPDRAGFFAATSR